MLEFINKYWKLFLIILLIGNLGLLIRQEFTNNSNDQVSEKIIKAVDENKKRIESQEQLIKELKDSFKDSTNVKVITRTINYEKIKTAPISTNITDKQLRDKLRRFKSEHNIK